MTTPGEQTDDTQLVATDTVYVSPDGGTTTEPFPAPDVEYDFCAHVANQGTLPSAAFLVRFNLTSDQDSPVNLDFQQPDGLDAGVTVLAVVHFGKFPNQFVSYHLSACIYSNSAPEKPISCAGEFDFPVNTQ